MTNNNLLQIKKIAATRKKYRPANIKCILIGEAPPDSIYRFFYYSDVKQRDYLFLGVMEVLYPKDINNYSNSGRPTNLKEKFLRRFQSDGFWLLDVLDIPLNQYSGRIKMAVPDLIRKLRSVATIDTPIILIKASIYDIAATTLREAGFKMVSSVRIHFPARGWKPEFISEFTEALKLIR